MQTGPVRLSKIMSNASVFPTFVYNYIIALTISPLAQVQEIMLSIGPVKQTILA